MDSQLPTRAQTGTHHIMPISRTIHQLNHLPSRTLNQHIEALPKTQLPHHIIREITEPITHIVHHALLLLRTPRIDLLARKLRTELSHMQQHDILHALQRVIAKRLAEHAPLPAMQRLVDRIVRVIHPLDGREGVVEIGLLDSLPMTVDVMQTLRSVHGDKVRRDPDVGPVLGVQGVEPEVAVTFEAVVELDPGGEGGEEGSGDVMEGVKEAVVDCIPCRLYA